jgi:hypothetical protein
VHTAVMLRQKIHRIISADRHFDAVPEIVRIDPLKWRGKSLLDSRILAQIAACLNPY